MATVFSYASFPYADGSSLTTVDTTWVVEYSQPVGRMALVASNRLWQDSSGDLWLKNSLAPANANQTVFADLYCASVLTNDAFGVLARVAAGRTGVYAGIRRTSTAFEVRAFHFVSGTATQIGTTVAVSFAAGETKRLQLEVTGVSPNISVVVKFDGVTQISQTINVATLDAAGLLGFRMSANATTASTAGMHLVGTTATDSTGAGDTVAPVLTAPTGTATGSTTASGTVTTDEANGTLYAVVTTSATPPAAADIRTGTGAAYATSQAVTATGVQNVTATGLTALTTYYWHFLHDDAAANASNIATSASFITNIVATTQAGAWSVRNLATASQAGAWSVQQQAGIVSATQAGAWTVRNLAATTQSGAWSVQPSGIIAVTEPLKNNTGTVLASQAGVSVAVLKAADMVSVYEATGMTTDASGVLAQVTNAAIVAATSYHVAIKLADGSVGITGPIVAA